MKSHAGKQNGERYDSQSSHNQDFFKVAGKSWRQKGYIDKKYCKKGFDFPNVLVILELPQGVSQYFRGAG